MIVASIGAWLSKPTHVPNDKYRLDSDIPYLIIEPDDKVKIKTRYSKRIVPMCGSTLDGARLRKVLETGEDLAFTGIEGQRCVQV